MSTVPPGRSTWPAPAKETVPIPVPPVPELRTRPAPALVFRMKVPGSKVMLRAAFSDSVVAADQVMPAAWPLMPLFRMMSPDVPLAPVASLVSMDRLPEAELRRDEAVGEGIGAVQLRAVARSGGRQDQHRPRVEQQRAGLASPALRSARATES